MRFCDRRDLDSLFSCVCGSNGAFVFAVERCFSIRMLFVCALYGRFIYRTVQFALIIIFNDIYYVVQKNLLTQFKILNNNLVLFTKLSKNYINEER